MKAKKPKPTSPEPASEDHELEDRIDQMMSLDHKVKPSPATTENTEPVATGPAQAGTAPELGSLKIPGVQDLKDKDGDGVTDKPAKAVEKPAAEDKPEEKGLAIEQPESLPEDPDEDPTLVAMVEDIVTKEGDALLAHDDAVKQAAEHRDPPKRMTNGGIGGFFKRWWHNKLARYGTLVVLFVLLAAAGGYPPTRYYVLNAVGVRSGASLTILDNTTQLPLKNVSVEIGGRTGETNEEGLVRLKDLQLGTQSLSISQTGFATITETVTLGLGSNPLGEYELDAVGVQFRVTLVDFLSGKPVKDAVINSDESNARSDEKGQIILTLDNEETQVRQAVISADGYRDEKLTLQPGQGQNRTIQLVPGRKHVYISKQSGKFDLYKSDIDGKNKDVLLGGTGNEDNDITVVQSPDGKQAALVSRRDTLKNQDGYVLQSLTLINIEKGTTLSLEKSERLQIVDWAGDRLVYVKIKAGSSAGSPDRQQLISYDYSKHSRLQLASANYFNDVISVDGILYYAANNSYQGGVSQFARIKPDNTGKQVLLDKVEVWNISRTGYDSFLLTSNQTAYTYKLNESSARQTTSGSAGTDRFYLDDADHKLALWADNRDGKGVLLEYDTSTGKDRVLTAQAGLGSPFYWLNERTAVYRTVKAGESADYAVSLDGGEPKKITDVTPTAGYGQKNY